MEEKAFFTAKEREQLFALYKRLLQLSGDTLQKGDCHKLKIHLIKAVAEGNLPRNCFGMNPIIKDMQTAVIVAEEITSRFYNVISLFNSAIPLIALKIIRCHTNFRHPFNLSWSGKTCDIRRSSKTTSQRAC